MLFALPCHNNAMAESNNNSTPALASAVAFKKLILVTLSFITSAP
jgi:hypothetical protein